MVRHRGAKVKRVGEYLVALGVATVVAASGFGLLVSYALNEREAELLVGALLR
jgi:hypothetical protein